MTKAKDKYSALTLDTLKDRLNYDPLTGIFRWQVSKGSSKKGKIAGSLKPSGYTCININKERYRAHRLAWFYMTEKWPTNQIDHINLNRSDNKFENLREATNQTNQINTKISKNNKSGYKGIYKIKEKKIWTGKWGAKINVNYKQVHLGTYHNAKEAGEAYLKAAKFYFNEFARD